jgi:hypothetical protein
MSDQTEKVECDEHGLSYATFVCQHLAHGSGLGFFYNSGSDDLHPDAWCAKCDDVMMAAGGWNEENEESAGITLLCAKCYDKAKERNQR